MSAPRPSTVRTAIPTPAERARQQALVDLLTPVVKGWCTEWGVQIASTGLQVHGGMGFIEETGAAQHYRDARITTIYEGTTGIQAMDLVGRKILRDRGAVVGDVIRGLRALESRLAARPEAPFPALRDSFKEAVDALGAAVAWLLEVEGRDPRLPLAAAGPFLELMGTVLGGHELLRAALRAQEMMEAGKGDRSFLAGKIETARFYAANVLPNASALAAAVVEGAPTVLDLPDEVF